MISHSYHWPVDVMKALMRGPGAINTEVLPEFNFLLPKT